MNPYDQLMETGDNGRAEAVLAEQGITGTDAESSYSTFLRSLAPLTNYRGLDYLAETEAIPERPEKAAALATLGLTPWQWGTTTMSGVVAALAAARKRLTTEEFNAAAARVFGSDALRVAVVLADNADMYEQLAGNQEAK